MDPPHRPLASISRTKSFDVLLDKTEAFVPQPNSSPTNLSSFVVSRNETVEKYLRTLDDEFNATQDEELYGGSVPEEIDIPDISDSASEDTLAALDSVDSFLQGHDYVMDLRKKLETTSVSKRPRPPSQFKSSLKSSAPPRSSQSPGPSSPSPAPTTRPSSRNSSTEEFVYSRPVFNVHVGSELARKIDEYRTDPTKRAELDERIQYYKDNKIRSTISIRNVLQDNKDMTRHLPEARAMAFQEQVANRERQIEMVLDTNKAITEEVLQRRLAIVYRKEIEAAEEEKKLRGNEKRSKAEMLQRRWLVLLAFGARQGKWMASLQQARVERLNFAHRDHAARVIQRAYYRYITLVRANRLHRQIVIVQTTLRKFIFRFRLRRKHQAADTIRRFFDDIRDTTRVAKVIKRFRFGVTHTQRYMREMLDSEKVQLSILTKQWNKAEQELETAFYHRLEKERARQAIMSKYMYYEGTSTRPIKAKTGGPTHSAKQQFSLQASPSLDAQYQQGFPKVPANVKNALLLHALREKKVAYGKQLAAYGRQQAKVMDSEKRKADIENARKILQVPYEFEKAPESVVVVEPKKPILQNVQNIQSIKSVKSATRSRASIKRTSSTAVHFQSPQLSALTTQPSRVTLSAIPSIQPASQTVPDTQTPLPRPIFKLLLTHEEAIILVNKGVALVQQQQKQMLLQIHQQQLELQELKQQSQQQQQQEQH